VEIIPGRGTVLVGIGERRAEVELSMGAPNVEGESRCYYQDLDPPPVIDYDTAGTVELVEIAYSSYPEHEVTLDGIQLTHRVMDDVIRDLRSVGFQGRPSDIGYDFRAGFSIWSMHSLSLADVDPKATSEDDRPVVEGVSVAEPGYFGF
jgi:hypothetical protein